MELLIFLKKSNYSKNINQDPSTLTTSDSEKEEIEKLLANDFNEEDQESFAFASCNFRINNDDRRFKRSR